MDNHGLNPRYHYEDDWDLLLTPGIYRTTSDSTNSIGEGVLVVFEALGLSYDNHVCVQLFFPYNYNIESVKWRRYWYTEIMWSEWSTLIGRAGGVVYDNIQITHSIPTYWLYPGDGGNPSKYMKNATTEVDYGSVILDYGDSKQTKNCALRIWFNSHLGKKSRLLYEVSDSGSYHLYKVYGEHNITRGTTDLIAGTSVLEEGCIHIVYE